MFTSLHFSSCFLSCIYLCSKHDLVLPLTGGLADRWSLTEESRKYPEAKLQENLDSEIMEVLLQEAREAYDEEIVVELHSNTTEDMETNVERMEGWWRKWLEDNKETS